MLISLNVGRPDFKWTCDEKLNVRGTGVAPKGTVLSFTVVSPIEARRPRGQRFIKCIKFLLKNSSTFLLYSIFQGQMLTVYFERETEIYIEQKKLFRV